jgi:dTDP-glucose pyrophosphorylase
VGGVVTAVVLAAGRGTRLRASDPAQLETGAEREAAARGLKVMMPIGADGRRWIDYALEALAQAGCRDAVLVVPPEHEDLRQHLAAATARDLRLRFAVQSTADGTAGAVLAAAAVVDDPWFLVANGDTLYPVEAVRAAAAIDGCGLAAFTRESLQQDSGFPVEKVAAFALVEHDAAGLLTGLREKPSPTLVAGLGDGALVSVNLWKMSQAIFDACRDVPPSPRGERELPDAVMRAVAHGAPFRVIRAAGRVFDLTSADDVRLASRGLIAAGPTS